MSAKIKSISEILTATTKDGVIHYDHKIKAEVYAIPAEPPKEGENGVLKYVEPKDDLDGSRE